VKKTRIIHFRSACGRYGVSFQHALLVKLLHECRQAGHNETGGILWGKYNANLDDAAITDFSPAPSDSRRGRFSFERGIAGLQTRVRLLWKKNDREYYLGEWHFHPFASSAASSTDCQQMFAHAQDLQLQCPEPIMIIIGGNPSLVWTVNIAVYTRKGEVHVLMPQESNWQSACSVRQSTAISPSSPFTKSKSPMNATCPGASLSLDTGKESKP
jgi:integrative and conjugative element protein (TIGR02256 family)